MIWKDIQICRQFRAQPSMKLPEKPVPWSKCDEQRL
jgi:hypothetical protein